MNNIWEIIGVTMTALGGGGVLVFGLSSWLGKIWAGRIIETLKADNAIALERIKTDLLRDIETHKVKLKKSELIFQKELDAASTFAVIFRSVHPSLHQPDMDWYDACDVIAQSFDAIEKELEVYFSNFSAVLTEEEKYLLSHSIYIAGSSKFDIIGVDVPSSANAAADNLYKNLHKIESSLIDRIHNQARI